MLDHASSLNKLIVLYLLKSAGWALTRDQIFHFMIGSAGLHYFRLQTILAEMKASGLLYVDRDSNMSFYHITKKGEDTLSSLLENLSEELRKDVLSYLEENRMEIRTASSVKADYHKLANGDYVAELSVSEGDAELIHIAINVPTEPAAQTLCANWKNKSDLIYESILQLLT